jgi:L-asparaginase II
VAEPAVEIRRGDHVESVARADVAVVDSTGRLTAFVGDPDRPTYWRSSAKPFQAIPVVVSGAAEQFGLMPDELAAIASSHNGEPEQLARVHGLMERIGVTPDDLVCGAHWPSDHESRDAMIRAVEAPSALHNNCSGKHTGMLALARRLGAPTAGYHEPEHPVQLAIARIVSLYAYGSERARLTTAIDGCGVPTFYLPLSRMAWAFARLVDPRGIPEAEGRAGQVVAEAMRLHPEVVGGRDTIEVRLARASGSRLMSKEGAEAVLCLGIPERGIGVAIKMDDGNPRTLPNVAAAVVALLGIFDDEKNGRLLDMARTVTYNVAGREVGEVLPVFRLTRGQVTH